MLQMETLFELAQLLTCTFHLLGCFVFQLDKTYLNPSSWMEESFAIADNSLESVLSTRFGLCTGTYSQQPCTPLRRCWEYVFRETSKLPATETQESPFEWQALLYGDFHLPRNPDQLSSGTDTMGVRVRVSHLSIFRCTIYILIPYCTFSYDELFTLFNFQVLLARSALFSSVQLGLPRSIDGT